jgi:hypothetical protein
MHIVVKDITDLNIPQSGLGKRLARLARECFILHQTLTVDFEGVKIVDRGFFQELFLPLVTEFGIEFLKNKLQITNVTPVIEEVIKLAVNSQENDYEQRAIRQNEACDVEIYELNLAWLLKARELVRSNSILAELMLGIVEDDMILAISRLSIEDIRHISQSGWLCFAPRFTTHFIQNLAARQYEAVDVLLELSGSLR